MVCCAGVRNAWVFCGGFATAETAPYFFFVSQDCENPIGFWCFCSYPIRTTFFCFRQPEYQCQGFSCLIFQPARGVCIGFETLTCSTCWKRQSFNHGIPRPLSGGRYRVFAVVSKCKLSIFFGGLRTFKLQNMFFFFVYLYCMFGQAPISCTMLFALFASCRTSLRWCFRRFAKPGYTNPSFLWCFFVI